jgi:hypothetical protein
VHIYDEHYIYEDRNYHQKCYIKVLTIRINKLDKLAWKHEITHEDALELADIRMFRDQAVKDPVCKTYPDYKEKPAYDQLICRPQVRQSVMRSELEASQKRLELARSSRWAWEAFCVLETNMLMLDSQPERPLLTP